MGQYHTIFNTTKREYVRIGGAKLWEQAHAATATALLLLLSNSNGRGGGDIMVYVEKYDAEYKPKPTDAEIERIYAVGLVSGRWAGDSLVVQGDYAEASDAAYIEEEALKDYKDISVLVAKAILAADPERDSEASAVILSEASLGFGAMAALSNLPEAKKIRAKREKLRKAAL